MEEKKMKKAVIAFLGLATLSMMVFTGCSKNSESPAPEATETPAEESTETPEESATEKPAEETDTAKGGASGPITIVSREDGSGTRGAFIELFGVEEKNDKGEKVDNTTEGAKITNSTSVMITTVQGDVNALGYISLGSLNDSVKAVNIDGVAATVENIQNETYKVVRPFNIVTKEGVSEQAKDFVDFIMSKEGQAVIQENGYIPVGDQPAYAGSKPAGKIVVAGSSSVTPVMEKLKEAYAKINTGAEIEIQQSDSTVGVQSTIDGLCDIGMASRDLKDTEAQAGLTPAVIAKDGLAVIANKDSGIEDLSSEQVKGIYTGKTTTWEELK